MIRVGQRLKEERLRKKLSLDQAARETRIRLQFLIAIEKGEYQKLPSAAYAAGFVKNYSEYLGLPKKETSALFRREFDEEKIYKVLPEGFTHQKEFPVHRIKIQQAVFGVVLVLLIIIGFLLYQYRFAFLSPPLTVVTPKNGEIVSSEYTISGKSVTNVTIFVNNAPVPVNAKGEFMKKVTLLPGGSTVITIRARNRLGKETTVQRNVQVRE